MHMCVKKNEQNPYINDTPICLCDILWVECTRSQWARQTGITDDVLFALMYESWICHRCWSEQKGLVDVYATGHFIGSPTSTVSCYIRAYAMIALCYPDLQTVPSVLLSHASNVLTIVWYSQWKSTVPRCGWRYSTAFIRFILFLWLNFSIAII